MTVATFTPQGNVPRKRPNSSLSCFPTFNLTWNFLMWIGQRQYQNRQDPTGLPYLARLSWSTSLEFLDFHHRGHDVDTICVQMLWVANWIAVDVYCGIWCCAEYDWINVTDVNVDTDCMYSVTACWVLVNADVYRCCCCCEFLAWGLICWLFAFLLFCHVLLMKNGINQGNGAPLADSLLSVDPLKTKNRSSWKWIETV